MNRDTAQRRDRVLRAFYDGKDWDENDEFKLKRHLVLHSPALLPDCPFLIEDEWDVVSGKTNCGRGDLVFAEALVKSGEYGGHFSRVCWRQGRPPLASRCGAAARGGEPVCHGRCGEGAGPSPPKKRAPIRSLELSGDLVGAFTDGEAAFAVVEVKFIDMSRTGRTVRTKRNAARSKVIEQAVEYGTRVFARFGPDVKVASYSFTNEADAPVLRGVVRADGSVVTG